MVALTKEFHLLIPMDIAHSIGGGLLSTAALSLSRSLCHGEGRKDCIVDWQVFCYSVVGYLIERTFYDRVLIDLFEAFKAKCMSTG